MRTAPTLYRETAETRKIWHDTQFEWGVEDCILSVTDHVRRVTGIDPAEPWRGTYETQEAADAICEPYGGVLGLFRHGMAQAGFKEGPRHYGCPVVISKCGFEAAGVDLGDRVMFRTEGGTIDLVIDVAAAWPIRGI